MMEDKIILEGAEVLNISCIALTPFRYITKRAKHPNAIDMEAKRSPDAAPAIIVSMIYLSKLKREIFSTTKALM